MGANKPERVRSGLIATLKMSGIVTIVTSLFIIFTGHLLMSLFTKDQEVIRIGDQYLTIISSFYLLFTLMFIYNGLLRGAGDTLIPMFFSLLSLWIVRIPVAWFLSGKIGPSGIWWAIPIGWLIGLVLSYFYYKSGNWKKKGIIRYPRNT
jgi:Na+-driven multidrug efflux pump